jgi:uncharacterized protein with FMN-binding domain
VKRAPWYVVTGAVAGFAAVFGLHGLAGAPAGLAQQKPAGGAAGGGTAAGGGDGPSATPTPTHRAAKGGGAGPSRTATGSLVNYGYGKLAVKVTVRGSNITVVSVSTLQTVDPFSQQLAQQDIPVLRSEVLAAHGARINAVSGATYTSQAYANSLQSALDKLHFG